MYYFCSRKGRLRHYLFRRPERRAILLRHYCAESFYQLIRKSAISEVFWSGGSKPKSSPRSASARYRSSVHAKACYLYRSRPQATLAHDLLARRHYKTMKNRGAERRTLRYTAERCNEKIISSPGVFTWTPDNNARV